MALLPNGTIHIHTLPEAETAASLLHVISPTRSLAPTLFPSLLSFNPGVFLVPTEYRTRLVRLVRFTLLNTRSLPLLPAFPTDAKPALASASPSASSPPAPPEKDRAESEIDPPPTMQNISLTESRSLVVGTEGLQACVSPPFLAHVERLLDTNQIAEVSKLAEPFPPGPLDMRDERVIDRFYIFARLALKCIQETMFDDAAEYFFHSRLDPRILIRLFPDLRGGLIRPGETVNVFKGIEEQLRHAETIEDISMFPFTSRFCSLPLDLSAFWEEANDPSADTLTHLNLLFHINMAVADAQLWLI